MTRLEHKWYKEKQDKSECSFKFNYASLEKYLIDK